MSNNKVTIKVKKVKNNSVKVNKGDWIRTNRKRFPKWVSETFKQYLLTSEEKVVGTDFKPFLHQKMVRDFLQNESPYRGLLLYHGLGSGKTCTSITIAENLKNYKRIVVMLPASIKDNYIQKGLMFCGDKRFKALPSLINDYYQFVSTNASNTLKQIEDLGNLDNHVIVVDEVHNLVSIMVSGIKGNSKQGRKIYELLLNSKNCKIVFLTGTPIINDPFEAGILLNVLRGVIETQIFKIVSIEDSLDLKYYQIEMQSLPEIDFVEVSVGNMSVQIRLTEDKININFDAVLNKIERLSEQLGIKIEFFTEKNYTAFPETEDDFENYFLDDTAKDVFRLKNKNLFIRRSLGLISYFAATGDNYPSTKIEYVDTVMSSYQYQLYEIMRGIEKIKERMSVSKGKSSKQKPTTLMRIYSRLFSNFVFPEEIPRPFKKGDMLSMIKKKNAKNNNDINSENNIEENVEAISKTYKDRQDKALAELTKDKMQYLTKEKLSIYSPKMKKILEHIQKSKGIVLVYSQFRKLEGIGIFSLVLEANGYKKYSKTGTNKNSFMIYSGEEKYTDRQDMLKVLNDPKNKNGDTIKIILISSAGSEGLDLKNIRQIHIMEPYWNEVRVKQVIGRGVRNNSHKDLPPKDRNVTVFRYFSVISETIKSNIPKKKEKDRMSTDQYIYEVALKKKGITDDIETLFKEVAVDCTLNKGINKFKGTCFNFGDDEEGFSYLPEIAKDQVYSSTVTTTRSINRKLQKAFLTKNKQVIVTDKKTKTIYSIADNKKSDPIKPSLKGVKKVRVDKITKTVYDEKSVKTGSLIKLGKYNKNGFIQ